MAFKEDGVTFSRDVGTKSSASPQLPSGAHLQPKQLASAVRTILPPFAHLLDHEGRRVCAAIQGSSSAH